MRSALVLFALFALGGCRSRAVPAAPRIGEPRRVNDRREAAQSEPSIAVDESGRTLVASWIDWSRAVPHVRLAVSRDGGQSFGESRAVLDPDPAHDEGQADPTVVAHAGNKFAVGWIGCRSDGDALGAHACDVVAIVSSDGALTWSAPRILSGDRPARRDRPWLAAGTGGSLLATWTELSPHGLQWIQARDAGGMKPFEVEVRGDDFSGASPPSVTDEAVEILLLDAAAKRLEWRSFALGSTGTQFFPYAEGAIPFAHSAGAFASHRNGEAWVAAPIIDERTDYALYRRDGSPKRVDRAFGLAGRLGAGGDRAALPMIHALGGDSGGRFLAAWLEHQGDGWNLRARILGPGTTLSQPARITPASFTFAENRTDNVGDSLAATSAGGAFWIVWSDTRDGDADVWIASGKP